MIDATLVPADVWQARVFERPEQLGVTIRRIHPGREEVVCQGRAGRVSACSLKFISRGDVERAAGIR